MNKLDVTNSHYFIFGRGRAGEKQNLMKELPKSERVPEKLIYSYTLLGAFEA